MKTIKNFILALSIFSVSSLVAQTEIPEIKIGDLKSVNITDGVSLHIISPEPIQFVDLSTSNLTGDLPTENIARIKITENIEEDSVKTHKKVDKNNLGVITVVCQSFMAQYKINYSDYKGDAIVNIQIQPEEMQPLEFPKMAFSKMELHQYSLDIIKKKKDIKPLREEINLKLSMKINNVYVLNDYIFLDMTFENSSNLSYDIDGLNFSVEDKKIYKATNNQSIEVKPVFQLFNHKQFKKNFRNIYVFKKFTYPNSKVFKIRLIEEQLSGRTIEMTVKYSDILNADTI